MKKIVFIIVMYKSDKYILQELLRVLDDLEVIKVDNTKKNLGYGGAANAGIRTALKEGAEWVVVMNQDLTISKKGIGTFATTLGESPPGVVGSFSGGLDQRRWTTILPSYRADYISGACMAIHKDVIEKIGFFYEPYFMYYEDVDYCIRAKKAEFPLIHTSIEEIKHDENPSLGKGSFFHEYYLARNHLLFVERQAPLLVKLYEYLRLPKTFAEAVDTKGKRSGLTDYFFRRFGERT